MKTGTLDDGVLLAIDKAIPFPLIFELTFSGKRKVAASYKRPSEADQTKWVISDHFSSDWMPEDTPKSPMPVALDLGGLYDKILSSIMPPAASAEGDIQSRVERASAIRAKTCEIEQITARLEKEKQFNKRVAINAELRTAKQNLDRLTGNVRN